MAAKHASYRDYEAALRSALEAPLTVAYGTSEYLLGEAVMALRGRALAAGAVATSLEAAALTEASLLAVWRQASLFEPRTHYVVRRCESARNLAKVLKTMATATTGCNTVCLVYAAEAPAAPLRGELTRLGARLVPCFDPWPNEVPEALARIAAAAGLPLDQDAAQLLIDANGPELVRLGGEVRRLGLILSRPPGGPGGAPLTAADVAPHLGMLREDDRYALDQLLLKRQWARAHALVGNLLARGERGLALLGMLASHCRNALRIVDAQGRGLSPQATASALRLPPFVVKTYAQHLGRGVDARRYRRALALCHEVDRALKSTPVADDLLIGQVLDVLAAP